jgi:peptidoglycan/xylan/chitin deacetylase (PgdA/CDA1 family)
MKKLVTTHSDFQQFETRLFRCKQYIRNAVIYPLSVNRKVDRQEHYLAFPYYHHVFNDEKKGFRRQLTYLKNFGDFITMDQAVEIINSTVPIKGRHFCVSFDDGFENCYTNMVEITDQLNVPVIIYLPTSFIGLDAANQIDYDKMKSFYPGMGRAVPFLNWKQCREMLQHQVSFGSHTVDHVNLAVLSEEEIAKELMESKQKIELELGISCKHFASPFGTPGKFFDPVTIGKVARSVGFISVASTKRGKMYNNTNAFLIQRDHLLANWGNYQLKYFFGNK